MSPRSFQSVPQSSQRSTARSATSGARAGDDLARLEQLAADALETSVQIALTADPGVASGDQAKAAAQERQRLLSSVQERAHRDLVIFTPRTVALRHSVSKLLLIGELGHINDLTDSLTQLSASRTSVRVAPAYRRDVLTLGHAGAVRLRALAGGLPAPAMDTGYLHAGLELRDVLAHLGSVGNGRRHDSSGSVPATCAGLAESVLLASRYAAELAAMS